MLCCSRAAAQPQPALVASVHPPVVGGIAFVDGLAGVLVAVTRALFHCLSGAVPLKCYHVVFLFAGTARQQLFLAVRVYPFLLWHQGWCPLCLVSTAEGCSLQHCALLTSHTFLVVSPMFPAAAGCLVRQVGMYDAIPGGQSRCWAK